MFYRFLLTLKTSQRRFEALAKQYATQIVYLIDCERLKSLPSTKKRTYAAYFRFIIADYFSDKTDRVLYLDADIACMKGYSRNLLILISLKMIAAVVAEGELNGGLSPCVTYVFLG